MKKAKYYINTLNGKTNGEYPKVSGYIEEVADSNGINKLLIGYDNRDKTWWRATELSTGFCVSLKTFETKKECVEYVHNNIDTIVEVYKKCMNNAKYYQERIKPFENFVNANGGLIQ